MSPTAVATTAFDPSKRDALTQRLFLANLQAAEVMTTYLGHKLGYYAALRTRPLTAKQLATRTKTDERYAREWLEEQAVAGFLTVAADAADPAARVFALPPEHAEVLLDETSLNYISFLPQQILAAGQKLPDLVKAYRTGRGLSWGAYGDDMRFGQAAQNRPFFAHLFASKFLAEIPDVHAKLSAGGRVAEFACGGGWGAISLAKAYPNVRVDGIDPDAPALRVARQNAKRERVDGRVRFLAQDAAAAKGPYDFVFVVEAVHDLAKPVAVLKAAKKALVPGGSLLVVDERVNETFTAPGSELERFFYAASVLVCLPNGRAEKPSAATGTVMRPATLDRYAKEAGFRGAETLPLEHDFFRFYRLRA